MFPDADLATLNDFSGTDCNGQHEEDKFVKSTLILTVLYRIWQHCMIFQELTVMASMRRINVANYILWYCIGSGNTV